MYGMGLLMLFYLLQLFLTLRSTMRDLEDTLGEVAFQKDALDEHAIVASLSPDGIINYVNDKLVEVSQFSREEIIGQPWSTLESDTGSDSYFENIQPTLVSGECWSGEIKNKRRNGSYYLSLIHI